MQRKKFNYAFNLSSGFAVYAFVVCLYVFWSHYQARTAIFRQIDEKLLVGARNLKHILPADYHDRALERNSISKENDFRNMVRLTRFAEESGFTHVYSIVRKDGALFFSSSSGTQEDLRRKVSWYYAPYTEAASEFENAFDREVPVFATVTDRRGTFRSAVLLE
ncbi:MAG: hypothetical protein GY866_08680, partial [Proteobacteria bacterium]|nr:hypothetical protein [Pseudomonadota bacterium]